MELTKYLQKSLPHFRPETSLTSTSHQILWFHWTVSEPKKHRPLHNSPLAPRGDLNLFIRIFRIFSYTYILQAFCIFPTSPKSFMITTFYPTRRSFPVKHCRMLRFCLSTTTRWGESSISYVLHVFNLRHILWLWALSASTHYLCEHNIKSRQTSHTAHR